MIRKRRRVNFDWTSPSFGLPFRRSSSNKVIAVESFDDWQSVAL
jgi:hypothetical protein